MYYRVAALMYSTHKHSAISPRLRLVLPLDRPVSVEEYEAIGRKVAYVIGMRYFDRTTFQAERLMYWPSTAKDGDYYFKEQIGEWLSADSVLAEYRDWRNVSEWPLCPTENEIIRSDLKKQEDPLEKAGVVGAFCRVYSISQAIEDFLPDVYKDAGEGRYTYCEASGHAGALVYEDKFLYSFHSTDPANNGHVHNAFDLVRIHKFGAHDPKASFQAMSNMARIDANVIHELGIFNLDSNITEGGETDWLKEMEVGKRGDYLPTIDNFSLVLRNDPQLKERFSYNEFDYRLYVKDGVPWKKDKKSRELDDNDEAGMRHYFEAQYAMYHTAKSKDAFELVCRDNSFHPVKEYLGSLHWDGIARLDTLFITQLGVPDTTYTRAVTRKALTACVARVMHPGIKFDYMVVTVGSQGKGKSSLLYDLGREWFSDTLDSVTGKDAYIQLQGVWLLEMAELSAIKKAELEAVKTFITKREDRFRPPFAKHNVTFKRQTVPFGSTNDPSFLKDPTGNRRFWPLVVTKKYRPGSIDADPIWAEAVHYYKEGEPLFLTEELEDMAGEQQLAHTEIDERAGAIEEFVEMLLPADWEDKARFERVSYVSSGADEGTIRRDRVCSAEIWCELFNNKIEEMSPYNTKFIHTVLLGLGTWVRTGTLSYKKYGNQRSYVRIGSAEDVTEMPVDEWGDRA